MTYEVTYYDRQGKPMTMLEWSEKLTDLLYKRVAFWQLDDVVVSTVWLGLNHSWLGHGPPIIFETMVFGTTMNETMWRYATEEQALQGHAEAVILVKSLLNILQVTEAAEPPAATSTPDSLPLPAKGQT